MALTLDMTKDIAPKYLVTVRIVGIKKWLVRLWIAKQLLKLVSIVANMDIKFEDKPWYGADL